MVSYSIGVCIPTVLTVRAINLNHQNLLVVEEPGKANTPRTGPLNTDTVDLGMRCEPAE
jgi:hypothetical protein